MIERLELHNFRGIVTGSIKLRKLTIIVGPNNSGKTSILEALLLAHGVDKPIIGDINVCRVITKLHETLGDASLLHLLNNYSEDAIVQYSISGEAMSDNLSVVIRRLGSSLQFFYMETRNLMEEDLGFVERDPDTGALKLRKGITVGLLLGKSRGASSCDLTGCKCESERRMGMDFPPPGWVRALIFTPELASDYLYMIYRSWIDLTALRVGKRVAEWISQVSGEEYLDILAEPFLGGLHTLYAYRARDGARIRLGDLGSGVKSLITARILVEYIRPQLLLWDDVEAHLNPRSIVLLSEWLADLADEGVQIVATTHSLEAATMIAGIVEDALTVRLNLVDGRLEASYYTTDEVEELKRLGIDVRG